MTPKSVSKIVSISFLMAVAIAMAFIPAPAAAWNFSVPAQELKPEGDVFTLPISLFNDGKAKYFEYKPNPQQRIRFFIVKSTDGVVRAAFDACEQCFRAQKGYVQNGDYMVCINCGLKFRTDKVNIVTGGCNPSALHRTVKDGKLIIAVQDVLEGARYFR